MSKKLLINFGCEEKHFKINSSIESLSDILFFTPFSFLRLI